MGLDPARLLRAVAALVLLGAASPLRAGEPVLVVANSSWGDLREIQLATLRRIYLGDVTRLGGRRVTRVHLRSGSPARETFSVAVLGQTELRMQDYWIEQALTGGKLPPREFATSAQVLKTVSSVPGAIGYLPASEASRSALAGLRVLRVRDSNGVHAPGDTAYPIQLPEPPPRSR